MLIGGIGLVALLFLALALINNRESARRATCRNNLYNLHSALSRYRSEHNHLPEGNSAVEIVAALIEGGYLGTGLDNYYGTPVHVCPGSGRDVAAWMQTAALAEQTCSYDIVEGVDLDSPPDFALAFDRSPCAHFQRSLWHIVRQRNVLLVGSPLAITYAEEEFQRRMAWQRDMMKRLEEGGEHIPFREWRSKGNGEQ